MYLVDYIQGVWKNRYILLSLVKRDLQTKYRRSNLGVAWSILTPLGLALIVGFVYSVLFGTNPKEFIPLLFASINPWLFMSGTADGATGSFLGAEGYIKQSTVSAQIFPLKLTLVNMVNLLYSIMAFFTIYLFLMPDKFGASMLAFIPGLVIMFIFTLGFANITAVVNLSIRDYQPLQSLVFQGLFYATPIIFPADMLREKGYEIVFQVNPFYYMLEVVRRPMLGNGLPSWRVYLVAISFAVVIFTLGIIVVMRAKKTLVYKL